MLSNTLTALTALLGAAAALNAPTQYKIAGNRLDCPAAGQTLFEGPYGGKWGILCGWDTVSTTFYKGPYTGLNFAECILKCGTTKDCDVHWGLLSQAECQGPRV